MRYKTTTLGGKPIPTHRKVWRLANRDVPDGFCLHHINGNKLDNRIENLQLMLIPDHTAHHFKEWYAKGNKPWNYKIKYGKMDGYKKSHKSRVSHYSKRISECLKLRRRGFSIQDLALQFGVCKRQIYSMMSKETSVHND